MYSVVCEYLAKLYYSFRLNIVFIWFQYDGGNITVSLCLIHNIKVSIVSIEFTENLVRYIEFMKPFLSTHDYEILINRSKRYEPFIGIRKSFVSTGYIHYKG